MRLCARSAFAILAAFLLGLTALSGASLAFEPDEVLKDAALEARARALSAELRCPVCQNQSIDDSNAPLSKDLRILVRERLVAGDSDAQVKQFLVARYGDFVLLKPPLGPATVVLWIAPLLLLAITVFAIVRRARRPGGPATPVSGDAPLSDAEKAELDRLLVEGTRPREG